MPEISSLVESARDQLGGLDIIIGNAGWTRFSDFGDLGAMSEAEWDRCWKTNVLGMKQCLQAALPTFAGNPDGGVFIITSSVAGKSLSGSSMAYSVTKAAQLHLMKCMANTQGPKVRVNAVLPGLLLTEWGMGFGEKVIDGIKERSALKKEVRVLCDADAGLVLTDLDRRSWETVPMRTSCLLRTLRSRDKTSSSVCASYRTRVCPMLDSANDRHRLGPEHSEHVMLRLI